ncbi:MAG TPA: hypothetical protein VFJ16_05850 [Longimicrobium sp.]|nr:hypothetical protein [Longimicrobium sp.]
MEMRLAVLISVATVLSACATSGPRPVNVIPLEQRAQALTAVINMRRQLFGPEPANVCDVHRLLDGLSNVRELIRADARGGIGPGDERTCGTGEAPRGSWRIVAIERQGGALRVRVSTTGSGGAAYYEDYTARGFSVTEVRIHDFVYD